MQKIMDTYERKVEVYARYCHALEKIVNEILKGSKVHIHSVSSRVKNRKSLTEKISRADKDYNSINELTDICGVRVIVYFEDEVDKVAEIIRDEFQIDSDNSIDKRKLMEPDRFGYLSYHLIAKLSSNRISLPEYREFSEIKSEIQIRSILQHGWAEIEHDLGYKSKFTIPNEIKRQFYRLAGLLEVADAQFTDLRNTLETYKGRIKREGPGKYSEMKIDAVSLGNYLDKEPLIHDLDAFISKVAKSPIVKSKTSIEFHARRLREFGLNTIQHVHSLVKKNSTAIKLFSKTWLKDYGKSDEAQASGDNSLSSGISISMLYYIIAASSPDPNAIFSYCKKYKISSIFDDDTDKTAKEVLDLYKKIKAKLK